MYAAPTRSNSFVAYTTAPERVGDSEGNAVTIRSSVMVREYPSIVPIKFEPKSGRSQITNEEWRTAYVTFSATSTGVPGLRNDFGASVAADTPTYDLLEAAHREQRPVTLAIETVRKSKNNDRETISPLTSIHELRGAQPDGKGGNANVTNSNCRNLIVGAGPANGPAEFNHEVTSNPDEWPMLRNNRDGSMPPDGWRVHEGAITQDERRGSTGVAMEQAGLDYIAAKVAAILMGGEQAQAQGSGGRPVLRNAHAVEGKPWEAYNSDGRVNAGSYLAGRYRAATMDAYAFIDVAVAEAEGEIGETVTATLGEEGAADSVLDSVRDALLWAADAAQVATYGEGAKPDRAERSHVEAGRWVRFTIETTFPMTADHIVDTDARRTWIKEVAKEAGRLMSNSTAAAGKYLAARSAPQNQPRAQATTSPGRGARPVGDDTTRRRPAPQPSQGEQAPQREQQAPAAPAAPHQANNGTQTTGDADPSVKTAPVAMIERDYLRSRYEALLAKVNLAANPAAVNPLLVASFGTFVFNDIDPTDLDAALTAWEVDPAAFVAAGRAAYAATQTAHQPA